MVGIGAAPSRSDLWQRMRPMVGASLALAADKVEQASLRRRTTPAGS